MKVPFRVSATAAVVCLLLSGSSWASAGTRHATATRPEDRVRLNPFVRQYRGISDHGNVVRVRELLPPAADREPQGPQGPAGQAVESLGCTFDDVSGLDAAQTVAYLRSHDEGCLYFLWSPDPNLALVFTQEKMLAVLAAIEQESAAYDVTRDNSGRLLELLRFVRVGFYQRFYGRPVAFDGAAIKDETIDALQAVEQSQTLLAPLSENFWTGDAERILDEWILTVDTVSDILADFYLTFESIVAYYADDDLILERLAERPVQRHIIFSTLFSFQRSLWREDVQAAIRPRLVEKLETLALNTPLDQNNVWLLNGSIWTLGKVVQRLDGELRLQALAAVEQAFLTYDSEEELEIEPYLWSILALPMGPSGCYVFIDGSRQVCRDAIAAQIRAELFRFRYGLDGGTLVFETSLSRDSVMDLHTATGQVKRQFVSVTGHAAPRPEDTNVTLRMVIYPSRRDYEVYHPFLTGLDTNNGGIYIESYATFYTYQREASESVYTLEDLVRHEYVHYLSGRFLIEGGFSQLAIYDNDRLTWFDEGLAEFLAGSTWCGVNTRPVLVELVAWDPQTMSIDEVVHAGYISGFKFYRYAALFIEFLLAGEEAHRQELSALITAIRDSNIDEYDALVDAWVELDAEFQAFLVELTGAAASDWPVIPFAGSGDRIANRGATCDENDQRPRGFRGNAALRARPRGPVRTSGPAHPL